MAHGLVAVLVLGAAGCATPRTVPVKVDDDLVRKELALQRKLAMEIHLGYRQRLSHLASDLLVAALPLCPDDRRHTLGMDLDGPEMYPEGMREFVRARLGLGPGQFVVAELVPGSPAVRAGLRTGDLLVSLNGADFKYREPGLFGDAADTLPVVLGGSNEVVVERGGKQRDFVVQAVEICNYIPRLREDPAINAFADGRQLIFNTGLLEALDDAMARQVMAHEIAHNTLLHQQAKIQNIAAGVLLDILLIATTGVDLGTRNVAALAHSKDFEAEADYVGLYIYARAGYQIGDASRLWRLLATKNLGSLFGDKSSFGQTHPSSPERYVAMDKVIEEIKAKQAAGEELLPNFKQ